MKKIFLTFMLLAALASLDAGSPGRRIRARRVIISPNGRKIIISGAEVGFKELNSTMKRLEDEIERMDRKLRDADPATKKGMELEQRRDTLALKFIHEAQDYILAGGLKRKDTRTRKIMLIMDNEAAVLKKKLAEYPGFPYLEYLDDPITMIRDIRRGKIKYRDRMPSRDSVMLKDIQKLQLEALEEIHKKQLDSRRK
jgi:hypothetical protein